MRGETSLGGEGREQKKYQAGDLLAEGGNIMEILAVTSDGKPAGKMELSKREYEALFSWLSRKQMEDGMGVGSAFVSFKNGELRMPARKKGGGISWEATEKVNDQQLELILRQHSETFKNILVKMRSARAEKK